MSIGKVGSKGELFPPKKLREEIGLIEGSSVIYRVLEGRLIIEKIPSIEDQLNKKTKAKISLRELKEEIFDV